MKNLFFLLMLLGATSSFGQKSYQRELPVTDPCIGSGIGNYDGVQDFAVFPNPSSGLVSIILPANGVATLTDLKGAIVRQESVTTNNQWDLSQLTAGVYLLSLYTDAKLYRTKLILEK